MRLSHVADRIVPRRGPWVRCVNSSFVLELRPPEETGFRVIYDVASSGTPGIEWSRENTGARVVSHL